MIPNIALATDQQGQYVMIVDDQNHAQRRSIIEGDEHGDRTVIRGGLAAGETVIVSGLQRVRDGMEVQVAGDNSKPVDNSKPTEQNKPADKQHGSKAELEN